MRRERLRRGGGKNRMWTFLRRKRKYGSGKRNKQRRKERKSKRQDLSKLDQAHQ